MSTLTNSGQAGQFAMLAARLHLIILYQLPVT